MKNDKTHTDEVMPITEGSPMEVTSSPQTQNVPSIEGSGSGLSQLRGKKLLVVIAALLLIIALALILVIKQFSGKKNNTSTTTLKPSTNDVSKDGKATPMNLSQETNDALANNDKQKALEFAKKALDEAPNNVERISAVANLVKAQDPSAAKQYYAKAFQVFSDENNLAQGNSNAVVNWAAANLAESAGYTDKAKAYYQQVIKLGNPTDGYEKSLIQQSQAALNRLS